MADHRYAPHDFNGDAYSDILWRNDAGNVAIWTLKDNQILDNNLPLGPVAADEHIVSSGDFNGDQTSDILWRNTTTGNIHEWAVENNAVTLKADIYNPGL